VLDLGCAFAKFLGSLDASWSRFGIDLSEYAIQQAHKSLPGVRLTVASCTAVPFKGPFQAMVAFDVIEHVDDRAALAEFRRVLRPGGRLVLTVPAFPFLWSERDELAGHRRRYRRRELRSLLQDTGYAVNEVAYYQFVLFPLLVASRFAGRRRSGMTTVEERVSARSNRLLRRVNEAEVSLGRRVRWPWGSTLAVVARTVAA